ncbi:cache domain-containing sensor histidine kinase [Lacrimispora brassicae]
MKIWCKNIFGSLQMAIFVMVLVLILIPTVILGVISYGQYRKIIRENATTLNQNNTTQIAANMEGIMKNVGNTSLSFFQNERVRNFLLAQGEEQVESAAYDLDRYVRNQLCYEEYVYGVDFVRMDGKRYGSSSITDGISKDLQKKLLEENGHAVFLTDIKVSPDWGSNQEELYGYARSINDINDIGTTIGFQKIYIKKSGLKRLLSDQLSEGEAYYVIEDGLIRISTEPEAEGLEITRRFPGLKLESAENHNGDLVYARVKYPGWYVIKKISPLQVEDDASVVRQLLISTSILAVVLCGIMGFFLSRFVIKPLGDLESSMRHLEEDDFKRKLPEHGYREISVLSMAFNRMTLRLDELVNRVYRAEIREKDAQIRAMQAYINPHFLYNTLDTICWMSRMEQAFETCSLIEALSKLFRTSVKDTSKTTTVAEEMEHIRNYIKIQGCRYTDTIEFEILMEPGTEECETVRFVLQPLVENAIVHGMGEQELPGMVMIRAYKQGEDLVLSVEDEGKGADVEELNRLLEGEVEGLRGMALFNVHERVKLCFGAGYGIHFLEREGKGLAVEVIQPFRKRGEVI